jgi:multiple sugar transport system ATP-binding protein
MHDGVLEQLGAPLEIYDHPATKFVATFVGSPPANVLPGSLEAATTSFVIGGTQMQLDSETFAVCAERQVTELGIRPEDLTVCDADRAGVLRGEVYVVEPLGNETLVQVRLVAAVVELFAERGWDAPIGASVGVTFDPAAACFFGPDGVTAVHRTDRPSARRPDRAAEVGDRQARERSVL